MPKGRLDALRSYSILDTPSDGAFDHFTEHAADLFDMPIAVLNFIDENRQWPKSCVGWEAAETNLDISFCVHTIKDDEPLVVPNAKHDERFATNPLVVGPPGMRFYAGAPLITPNGYRIGTLCVFDTTPRSFSEVQERQLQRLTAMAIDLLEQRRKRLDREQKLREREAHIRGIANSIPGVVFQFFADADGQQGIQFVGENVSRILGGTFHADMYDQFIDHIPAEYTEAYRASVEASVQTQTMWEHEFPFEKPNTGERIWLHGISMPKEGGMTANGKIVYNGVLLDITERKERERERASLRNRMQLALEKTSSVIFDVDLDTQKIAHAGPTQNVFQVDADAIPDWHTFTQRVVHPKDRERLLLFLDKLRRGEEQALTIDCRTHPQNGPVRWMRGSIHRVERSGSDAQRIIGLVHDITKRKQSEQERRMLAAAIEHATEAVLITEGAPLDAPGPRIIYVNPAFESMTGYNASELIGQTPRIFQGVKTETAVLDKVRTHLDAQKPVQAETVNYRKDGTPYIVSWNIAPVRDEEGAIEYWASLQRDVTEQRKREDELRQAKEKAEKAVRLKEAMLANMSHEVRTPLTSMMGFAEILAEELSGPHAKQAEIIYRGSKRLHRTLESMLQLSELRGGAYQVSWNEIDLRTLVEDVVQRMRPQADANRLALRVDVPPVPVNACIDEVATERIVTNLLDNAIKFTPAGGTIVVRVSNDTEAPLVEVEDTGIGIAKEALDEVFKAFKQESEGLARTYEGSGLGLAIVKKLVEQMQGTVTIKSEKGEGTRVQVRLPSVE